MMPPQVKQWTVRAGDLLQWCCLTGANWFILVFMYVAFSSLTYPFNLEWMEGQTIDVMQRILNGQPVYTKPSLDYVAYIYTPLYFYTAALVAKITGIGFFPARLVSTMSIIGVAYIMFLWIRRKDGDWQAGVIGAGLFLATYRLSGRWFDNSRVDSLFLLLTMSSLYTYTFYRGFKYALLAALLGAAAFFTKQAALFMLAPVLVAGLVLERRHAFVTAAALTTFILTGIVVANWWSDGWFNFFVFKVPSGHGLEQKYIVGYWKGDMFKSLTALCLASIWVLAGWCVTDRRTALRYGALASGFIICSYISRIHWGGYMNVLMPMHLCLALMTGLALSTWRHSRYAVVFIVLTVGSLTQMRALFYDPQPLIPSQQSWDAGNRFLEDLSKVPGDIFIPELQYVQTRVGKKSYTLGMAAFDIMRSDLKDRDNVKKEMEAELNEALASGRFSAVIPGRLFPTPMLYKYYQPSQKLHFPREYVTGAINFLRTDLFVRIPESNKP